MMQVRGYAALEPNAPLVPFRFERRDPGPHDVQIEILYAGICHSDLHQARGSWGAKLFPMVPGHEIVGRVVALGERVAKLRVGDIAGVGCMVDSCRQCSACAEDLEQYCEEGPTWTYNDVERDGVTPTYGGYSEQIVVEERFVVRIPKTLPLEGVAPLLCAGITTWSPLRHWRIGPGDRVGIIGLGGLGHMGVKLAKALGAHVVMISTSPDKGKDAERPGADEVLISRDSAAMTSRAASFDFLLDTIPVGHDINPYLALLRRDRAICLVGALEELTPPLDGSNLIFGRKSLSGSGIGGMAQTQEMIDFCAERGLVSDVELVPIQTVNEAWERLARNDVKYRFVIDLEWLRAKE